MKMSSRAGLELSEDVSVPVLSLGQHCLPAQDLPVGRVGGQGPPGFWIPKHACL